MPVFAESALPLTPTPNSFQGVLYCRSAPTVASDLILKELDGQYLLFYNPFPFALNLDQSLGSILLPIYPTGLGMLVLRSNEDFQV